MTATARNPAIGTCPCPVPKCSEQCEVRKFQNRSTRDTGHRFAGKLYLICPAHGRLGMDAKEAMQDYILERATMIGPVAVEQTEAEPPASAASVAPPTPAAAPAVAAPASPLVKQPAKPRGLADWDW